jgi:hypothetical protein
MRSFIEKLRRSGERKKNIFYTFTPTKETIAVRDYFARMNKRKIDTY